ncbi:hypothetical protein ABR737_02260 [Streptomyces sp. Edi2]|uniref:hypothetical protein n=1 Tax=Streptomyces sp. Edi2 TaxID=3162528 RepID=UPI00330601A9
MTAKFTNLPWPAPVPATVHPREETPESEGPVPAAADPAPVGPDATAPSAASG